MEVIGYRRARNIPQGMKLVADARGGPGLGALKAGYEAGQALPFAGRSRARILR
jgi:hypothetical protein